MTELDDSTERPCDCDCHGSESWDMNCVHCMAWLWGNGEQQP